MQHFGEKLAVPIVVALVAMGSTIACWSYLVDTMVQAVVPDRIDFAIEHIVAIELEHIVAIDNVPKVVHSIGLGTNGHCLGFDRNFDMMIRKVNHMHLTLNSIVGVDVVPVHICPFDGIVILWENLLSSMSHHWIRFLTSNVGDELVFFHSCHGYHSCRSHFDDRCSSDDVLIFYLYRNDLGIVVPVRIVCILVHMLRLPF